MNELSDVKIEKLSSFEAFQSLISLTKNFQIIVLWNKQLPLL